MSSGGTFLRAHQGKDGAFISWLENMGLKDLLRSYPLSQLVEWGWLVPQSRVIFSKEFLVAWEEFPSYGNSALAGFDAQGLLWDSSWFVDNDNEPLWFLDPFFRPEDEAGQILLGPGAKNISADLPSEFTHPNGLTIIPYADYFFHWQGYALIDVIRTSDNFGLILNTPDLQNRLQNLMNYSESAINWKPEEVLILPSRWGGLAEPMTWLSHYRAFRDAVSFRDEEHILLRKGAIELATHLGVTAEKLSSAVKEKLLVLAQDWRWANDRYCEWTQRAYPYLQADIQIAMEWLYFLTGNKLDFYLEKWQYDTMGQSQWAELHAVLEYEFFTERKLFLKNVPKYFNEYCKQFADETGLNGDKFGKLVDAIRSINYPFASFLGAFRQMHEEMTYRFEHKGGLDFRERRPLDFYSILAIRAEGCLRFALEKDGVLNTIKPKEQGLRKYIECLAQRRGLSNTALARFKEYLGMTQLHESKEYPIASIMKLNLGLSERENYLIQAFLSCELARNYFAHHYCFDKEVRKSKESGFMLTGILVTVLYLLEEDER